MRERGPAVAIAVVSENTDGFPDGALHVVRIFRHVGNNLFERYRVVFWVPTIIISNQSEGSVTKFGLSGELSLGDSSHSDHVKTQLPVGMRFGQG